jgi:hypothetical protein
MKASKFRWCASSPSGECAFIDPVDIEPTLGEKPRARLRRRALARVHRRYAGAIQARRKRSGHFWQGRFGAVAMDEEHLAAALRYVSLNPVRARLVERAQDCWWSSTAASTERPDRLRAR